MDQDVLFILIIVLTVVINIVKAVRKKGQAATPQPARPAAEDNREFEDFDEILRKVMAPSKRLVPQASDQDYSIETLEPLGGSLETIQEYEWTPPVYTTSSLEDDMHTLKPSVVASEEGVQMHGRQRKPAGSGAAWHAGDPIDFRSAIIYQTILDRPYA